MLLAFLPRRASALVAVFASSLIGIATSAWGSNPAGATLGTSSSPVTFTGTATGTGAASGESSCREGINCDTFTLTVSGTASDWATANKRINIVLPPPTPSDDYDFYVHRNSNSGPVVTSSGGLPGATEQAYLNPATSGTGVFTVHVVYGTTNVAVQYQATVSVEAIPVGTVPPAPTDSGVKAGYETFEAPGTFTTTVQSNGNTTEWLGRGAGEPSIGVNWKSPAPNNVTGVTNFQSDLQTLFVTFNDTGCPAAGAKKDTWANRPAPTSQGVDSDPIGFTNTITGRVFAGELTLLSPSCKISYTDDDGANWVPTAGPAGAAVDHQTIAGGAYHVDAATGQPPPYATVGGNAFYYCSQDLQTAYCMRSDNGGNNWTAEVPWSTGCKSQLHGHVKVAPDGTVYIPDKNCHSSAGVGVSTDNGTTWTVSDVASNGVTVATSASDPAIGIDKANKVYFAQAANDTTLVVATGTMGAGGMTWSNIFDVSSALGIKGVRYPAAIGGDAGRAAIAFLGTKSAGNLNGNTFWGLWHMYVATTFDGGASWSVADATPNLPVQRGCIWTGGGGDICRNLLDFFDVAIDKQGRVEVGYVNGCPGGACAQAPQGARGNDYSATATITRQSSGRRLIANFDPSSSTAVPGMPVLTVRRVGTIAHLGWSEGDTGNSAITQYNILRGTSATALSTIATVAGDQSRYDDNTATDPTQTYYYAVQAVNAVGVSCANNVVAAPYVGDTCPGLAIHQNDPTHQESAQVQNGLNPQLAIDYFTVAEPIQDLKSGNTVVAAGGTYFKFTMKVSNLTTIPASSRWRMVWDSYDASLPAFDTNGQGGQLFFVGMRSDSAGAVTFNYGTVGDAGLPAVLVLSEDNVKTALSPSNFSADGTITVYVPKAGVGNALSGGDILGAMGGKTFTGDSGPAGNYQRSTALIDHTFVKGVTDNSYPAAAYVLRDAAHVTDNHAPRATVAVDKNYGNPGTTITFTGTQADPLDGDVSGAYVYDFGEGTPQTKLCAQYPNPSFACASTTHKYNTPGYYTAVLVARDSCDKASDPQTVLIHINAPPVAAAGDDFSVDERQTALLTGANSTDADGDPLTYAWTQTAGPAVTLVPTGDPAAVQFVAPEVAADTPLTFKLTVTDSPGNLSTTDTVVVTVRNVPDLPPVAAAGNDFSVNENAQATLDGSASADAEGPIASFLWEQTAGPAVALSSSSEAKPTFTAPAVANDTPLTFKLTVTDSIGQTAVDSVTVTVVNVNIPPVANAGADQTVDKGKVVTLAGSATDADGEALTLAWTQVSGPTVTLIAPATATPHFTAPQVKGNTAIVLRLTATDTHGGKGSDEVTVFVNDPDIIGNNGVGGLPAGSLLVLGFAALARRRRR